MSHAPDVKQGPRLDPWVGQPWSSSALLRAGSVGGGEGLKGVVTREVDRRVSTDDWQSLAVRVVRAHGVQVLSRSCHTAFWLTGSRASSMLGTHYPWDGICFP